VAIVLAAIAGVWLVMHSLRACSERREALRLAHEGRFADAEPLLQRALARRGGDVEVLSALALGKLGSDDPSAEEYLTRWCELCPGEAQPYRLRLDLRHRLARGERNIAERLRRLGQALADGQRVLELDPDHDEVRREVAWLLLGVGRFDEAERACRYCLARGPADPWLLYLLAKACHARGKRAEAEALLDPVVRDQPRFAEALLLRAILHREADQPDRAVPLLRQALALDRCPRKDCLYQLGLALAGAGQDDEARRVMAEVQLQGLQDAVAFDNFPNTPAMRVQIGEAMLDAGKPEEALALLEALLAEAPDFAPAHRVLARYYEQKGQADRAAEHRRRAGPERAVN
jgi:tetratricopeptide (TPR) repeat protein